MHTPVPKNICMYTLYQIKKENEKYNNEGSADTETVKYILSRRSHQFLENQERQGDLSETSVYLVWVDPCSNPNCIPCQLCEAGHLLSFS